MMLSDEEQSAIKVLKGYGWQIVTGAHLEDWDEGVTVKTEHRDDEGLKVRSKIAIIKV